MIVVQDIPVALCRPSPNARPTLPIQVEILARSIADVGLLQPINVREIDGWYEIRGGGHRHAAFVHLGLKTIPAFVRADDDLHAELAEIDENLARNDLSPAQRAAATARRKAIYETLHPETVAKVAGGKARQGSASDTVSFAESTAKATGKNRRTIQRDAKRGAEIAPETLHKVVGTSLDEGKELDALAKLSEEKRAPLIERAVAGERVSAKTALKQETRDDRERDLGARQIALPAKRYGVIYCDYARRFNVRSRETGLDRSPDNHYPTMTFAEIVDLPVASIAADDCILFMWSTAASLLDDLEIMAEWGFVSFRPRDGLGKLSRPNGAPLPAVGPGSYRSHQIWHQDQMGLGYWFRDVHEVLLVGARGNVVAPAPGTQEKSVVTAALGEHSAKPACFSQMIERLYPSLPKIELFARSARPGWDAWGLEAPLPPHDPETGELIEEGESLNAGSPDGRQQLGRADEEQRDAARVPGAERSREGGHEGDQGRRPAPARADREDGPEPGTLARQDQDGRSRDVGGQASDQVESETEAQRTQPAKPTVDAPMGDEPAASEREPVTTGSGEAHGRCEPASPTNPTLSVADGTHEQRNEGGSHVVGDHDAQDMESSGAGEGLHDAVPGDPAPTAFENDDLEIPNFLRHGHPDCIFKTEAA